MENLNVEELTRELESLKSLQIYLSGYEANALIMAVQMARDYNNDKNLAPILNCAETAALKLQKLFVNCPVCYSVIERGWEMSYCEKFPPESFPPESFPPESFVL